MKQIISFIGRAGSGKDYQCNLLEKQGYKKLAFADALRDIAFSSLGLDVNLSLKHYESLKSINCIEITDRYENSLWQHVQMNFRKYLELLGTQGIRKYDNDFWVKCLIKTIKDNKLDLVCISDMRFANEYYCIRNFAQENNYNFKCVFCNYHSDRYQHVNNHESARLANNLVNLGFKDLQELTYKDIDLADRQQALKLEV